MDKRCINGSNPEAIFQPFQFTNEGGAFWDAPDLKAIAGQLIRKLPDFPAEAGVRYLWKAQGGHTAGKGTYGKCVKASGLTEFLADADYVIWLAHDFVSELRFTNYQVEALLYHNLLHVIVEQSEDGPVKLKVRAHDIEAFREEISEYGFWAYGIVAFAQTVQRQLSFEDAMAMPVEPAPAHLSLVADDEMPDDLPELPGETYEAEASRIPPADDVDALAQLQAEAKLTSKARADKQEAALAADKGK